MPPRPSYSPRPEQTVIDFDAPIHAPEETNAQDIQDIIAEPAPPAYAIEPAWIDTAGRTRTWALRDPHGTQMAEITTKSAAQKLAQLLNNVTGDQRGPAR